MLSLLARSVYRRRPLAETVARGGFVNGQGMSHGFERYRELLDSIIGARSIIADIEPRVVQDGPVCAISYVDVPDGGYVTGFTYGLSLSSHPDWAGRGRELSITVRSNDVEWSRVPARIVAALRGICPFGQGQVLGYKEPYVAGSPLNSVVLAAPALEILPTVLDLDGDGSEAKGPGQIEMIGVYPIYSSERELAYSQGTDALWRLSWDRFDPLRLPAA